MKCTRCGAENWDTSSRCSVCGDMLEQHGRAEGVSYTSLGGPPRQRVPTEQEVVDAASLRKQGSYEYIYDEERQTMIEAERRGGYLVPTVSGTRSVGERPTYLTQYSAHPERKRGYLYFNRKLLPFIIPVLIAGALFVAGTFCTWMTMADGAEVSGWDLYQKGKAGMNGGNALYIPDVINADREDYQRTGLLFTGVWTLAGGVILLFLAGVVVFLYEHRILYFTALLSTGLLVVTSINLFMTIFSRATMEWPIYSLPAITVAVIIIALDARRAYV